MKALAASRSARTADSYFAVYLQRIQRFPMPPAAEEHELAKRWCERDDRAAADRLLTSHLRLVVKTATLFRGYGLPMSEVIAEGNLGLMAALKRFDPDKGLRFSTYAMFWIKAAMQAYVLRSWSLVKIGTTLDQRKLFFKLRSLKRRLSATGSGDLRPDHVSAIASRLRVREQEVVAMNRRLAGDQSLNVPLGPDTDSVDRQDQLTDHAPGPEEVLCEKQEGKRRSQALAQALGTLMPRERQILEARRLRDDPTRLEVLAARLGISRERVRQIEVQAFRKVERAVKQRLAAKPVPSDLARYSAGLAIVPRQIDAGTRARSPIAPAAEQLHHRRGEALHAHAF